VFAGFAYLDSEIVAGTAAQTGTGLPLVPRVSGNLWTTYRLPFGLTVGGGAQYSGEANRLQTSTAAPVTMPSYWICNALAAYDVNEHLTLRCNVSNLCDEDYAQSYNNNGGRFSPGAPRAYLLTASWKF
jgi:catecholate siderophore receptor